MSIINCQRCGHQVDTDEEEFNFEDGVCEGCNDEIYGDAE